MRQPTQIQHPRVPLGCTDQGRQPQAAEPCTDIGADDFDDAAAIIVGQIACIILIIAAIAAVFAFQ